MRLLSTLDPKCQFVDVDTFLIRSRFSTAFLNNFTQKNVFSLNVTSHSSLNHGGPRRQATHVCGDVSRPMMMRSQRKLSVFIVALYASTQIQF
jgi:hypothetical protein